MGTTIATVAPPVTAFEGEQDEFFSSYRSQLSQLVGYFRAKGVPRDEAADMANETMVRLLVHLKRHGRSRTDLGPLVRTIARNLLIERVRKAPVTVVPLGEDVDVADDALEPADHVLASERREAVREAIRSLSPRHRHVVGMWMEGRTPGEIARSLGVKRNAVDAILHRARRSLASKLDGGGALGLVAIIGLRLRMFGRRVAGAIGSIDPSGQATQSSIAVAAASLAVVLTFGGSAQPTTVRDVSKSAAANAAKSDGATVDKSTLQATTPGGSTDSTDGRAAAPQLGRKYEVRIGPGLASDTPESDEARVADVSYDPNKNGHSDVDSVLEVAFELCAVTQGCASEDR